MTGITLQEVAVGDLLYNSWRNVWYLIVDINEKATMFDLSNNKIDCVRHYWASPPWTVYKGE